MGVFLYDLIRTTRRSRLVLLRVAYALVLLAALRGVYVRWFPGRISLANVFVPGPPLSPRELAQFAQHFTATCLLVQFGALLLLTPATVAGAIAEERQRGTLDLLLISDLSAFEIVAGKWLARGVFLFGILLTGVPVLALTFLFGGVEPGQLLECFALMASSLVSLTGLSLFCSVRARTVTGAVTATYGLAAAFGALTAFEYCGPIFNPFYMTSVIVLLPPTGVAWATVANLVGLCCGVHIIVGIALVRAAGLKLRGTAGPQGSRAEPLGVRLAGLPAALPLVALPRLTLRPPIGQDALLWKELHFDSRVVGTVFRRAGFALGASMFVTTFGIFAWMLSGPTTLLADGFGTRLNPLFRFLTIPVFGFAMIGVTLAAAGGATHERERHTLDGLLCLPRGRDQLLRAWWLGSVWHVGRLTGGLLGLGMIASCVGSFHVLVFPLFLLTGAIHAAFGACLGLYLSVAARTTTRAFIAAIVCVLAVCLLPPLAANFWDGMAGRGVRDWPWVGPLLREGLSPPLTWWRLTDTAADSDLSAGWEGIALGLAAYALAGLVLWRWACHRFEREGHGGHRP